MLRNSSFCSVTELSLRSIVTKIIFSFAFLFTYSCLDRNLDTTPEVSAVVGDSEGKVYIGFGLDKKVSIYDGSAWNTITLPFGLSYGGKINSILAGQNGIVWVGASDGIYKISGEMIEYKEDTFSIFKCANVFQIPSA